jgi:hypothetical protein
MICGNEEAIILRCLESAKGAFDELCLVRAIGSREPDATIRLAEKWCQDNGKRFQADEYKNLKPFPHADNFGAARQLSFDLATCDWCLWLDCDDYLDEINCQRIREASEHAEFDSYFCTYLVEKQGAEIERERLIKRGAGRWKNAIHETCVVDPKKAAHVPQICVYHSNHKHKHHSSAARNAAILEGVLEDAPRHYFYLQAELKMLGRKEDALKAAKAALALIGDSEPEWRYNVLLNLSELELERTREHLLEAAKAQPHRREAFAYLCQKSLIDGNVSDAISYFRLMDSLPLPSPLPWTHQGIWYGWARNFLKVRVLRASNNPMAEAEHQNFLQDPEYAREVAEYEQRIAA